MPRTVFLHAGPHKTGTTSIQSYLTDNKDFFSRNDISVVLGPSALKQRKVDRPLANSIDIAHSIIRPELKTPIRLRRPEMRVVSYQQQQVDAARMNRRLKAMQGEALIVSAESFSFLRQASERKIFDMVFDGFEVQSILFFRNPKDWMISWRKQTADLLEQFGSQNEAAESIFNYESTSWLVDQHAIADFFQPRCQVFSYEDALANHGSVIPVLLKAVGLTPAECPPWSDYWRNRS